MAGDRRLWLVVIEAMSYFLVGCIGVALTAVRAQDLMATSTSSTDMRPTGPDAYMEPKTTPPRERRSSVGCM